MPNSKSRRERKSFCINRQCHSFLAPYLAGGREGEVVAREKRVSVKNGSA
jgi:hypothetical protein